MTPRRAFAACVVALSSVAALFAIERTAANDDAAQYWVMAGRLARTGDPFYVAAVDHKGPVWVWVYRVGYAISGDQRYFWFLMAAGLMLFAVVIGWVLHRIIVRATGDRLVGRVAAVATVAFLWFGPESYSKILYGRNITVALTAVAVLAVVRALDDDTRRATLWLIPAGVALGLASSTVLTTLAPVALVGASLAVAGVSRRRSMLRAFVLVGSTAATLAAVAVWYVVRAGDAFRIYVWDYNRIYASTDEPLVERATTAIGEMGRYHLAHPYLLAGPVGVLAVAWFVRSTPRRAWSRTTRTGVVLVAWWAGEAASVAAPGRWFDHYWILLVVPTAALAGLAVARVRSLPDTPAFLPTVRWRRASVLGLSLVILVGLVSVPRALYGLDTAAAFDGFTANERHRWADSAERVSSLRSATAALTDPGEAIYVWAPVAAFYVAVDRPAATRFDRRTWHTGEVYGSDVIAELPGVWDDLMSDLDESRPRLVIERLDEPIPDESPLAALLASQYRPVFDIEPDYARLYLRVADEDSSPPAQLAAREISGRREATCLALDNGVIGEVVVAGAEQEIAVRFDTDRVVTSSTGGAAVDHGVGVESLRGTGGFEIRIGTTWVVVWQGDRLVGAVGLDGPVREITSTAGPADAVRCAP